MPTHKGIQNILKPVFDRLKEGDLNSACSLIANILEDNLENEDVKCTYTAIVFWKEKFSISFMKHSLFERGEYLFSQWKLFLSYMKKYDEKFEFVIYTLKVCMFKMIIDLYTEAIRINDFSNKTELYRKIGLSYKVLGNYERAIEFLQYASTLESSNSKVLAELADSYAMCGDERLSKVYFREAFFKDPENIEEDFLESDIIRSVINKLKDMRFSGAELLVWLPVYAVLWRLFTVKRQLKAIELGKLKQDIFLLENMIKDKNNKNIRLDVPKLINSYFWLIDYYSQDGSNKSKIDEILLRIKLLNEDVYNQYIR